MAQLEIVQDSIIFRNPNPGYQAVMAAGTHPVQIAENELVCPYNRGQAYYATDLTFYMARSTDGGATWSEQSLIYDRSRDNRHYSYHDPFTTRLRDGRLIIFAFRTDRSDPERALFNEKTGGLAQVEIILFRSIDNGRSWTGPEVVPVPPGYVITPSSPLVELANGQWMLHFDQWHGFDEPGPYRPRSIALFSSDEGRTWSEPLAFGDGEAQGKGFWHGRIITLNDGRLFTLFWSDERKTATTLPLHRCFGTPDGRQWSTPEPTNIPGQTNYPVDLGQGRLAAIYTRREGANPGFFVTLSADGGKTWDIENQLQVWDATGRDKLGVEAPDAYPRSHDTIAFGAPNAIRLLDGDILASFWCTEMSITHVRSVRLRVR